MQFLIILVLVCIAASGAFIPVRASSIVGKGGLQMMEKTYIMVKPDGVQRGVVGLYQ